jgi:hypothetical protein
MWRWVYLVTVPLGWAVLLVFHPNPDPEDISRVGAGVFATFYGAGEAVPPIGPVGLVFFAGAVVLLGRHRARGTDAASSDRLAWAD